MAYKGLPDFIEDCGDKECSNPHFLTLNRDINGQWSAGYIEFENHSAICAINSAETLDEVVIRLKASIKRNAS